MALHVSFAKPRSRAARLGWIAALALGSMLGVSGCASMAPDAAQAAPDTAKGEGSDKQAGGQEAAQGGSPDAAAAKDGADGPSGSPGRYRPEGLPNIALTPPLL